MSTVCSPQNCVPVLCEQPRMFLIDYKCSSHKRSIIILVKQDILCKHGCHHSQHKRLSSTFSLASCNLMSVSLMSVREAHEVKHGKKLCSPYQCTQYSYNTVTHIDQNVYLLQYQTYNQSLEYISIVFITLDIYSITLIKVYSSHIRQA